MRWEGAFTENRTGSTLGTSVTLKKFDAIQNAMKKLKVARITTTGAGYGPRTGYPGVSLMQGYRMWPKIGFNSPLAQVHLDRIAHTRLSAQLAGARDLLDLQKTAAGRAFWRDWGAPT